MYRKSYCTTLSCSIGVGVGVSKMIKFFIEVFHVMGKGLSGPIKWFVFVCGDLVVLCGGLLPAEDSD